MQRELFALLPAYNVESYIGDLIHEAVRYVDKMLIINDGSKDRTSQVLARTRKEFPSKVDYISNEKNMGKADAMKVGLRVLSESNSPKCIICLDADLAHSPREIPNLIANLDDYDMIIGNRYAAKKLEPHRNAVVMLASVVLNRFTGYNLTDPVCGFRAFNEKICQEFASRLKCRGYGLELEEIMICQQLKARVKQYDLEYVVNQDDFTKAKEFRDIVETLLAYSDDFDLNPSDKQNLSFMLRCFKERISFEIKTDFEGMTHMFKFMFIPSKNSYTLSEFSE